MNKKRGEVFVEGKGVENLTRKELDVVFYVGENRREVFWREEVLEEVWGYEF